MTNKETRQWAMEQASRFLRSENSVELMVLAENIYEFVNTEQPVQFKSPTPENCPETYNNVCNKAVTDMDWVSKGKLGQVRLPEATNEGLNSVGILKHMDTPLTPKECYEPTTERESETMTFDTLDELMSFITNSRQK